MQTTLMKVGIRTMADENNVVETLEEELSKEALEELSNNKGDDE